MNCWFRDDTYMWCNIKAVNILLGELADYIHEAVILLCPCFSNRSLFFCSKDMQPQTMSMEHTSRLLLCYLWKEGQAVSSRTESLHGPKQEFWCSTQTTVVCQSKSFINRTCKQFGHYYPDDHHISHQFKYFCPCPFCLDLSVLGWEQIIMSFLESFLLQYRQIKWFCVS